MAQSSPGKKIPPAPDSSPVWRTSDELKTLCDIAGLPCYRTDTRCLQVSTYDPTGGNEDGFSGDHSFIRRNPDSSLVIFESAGPGVIERIWTPTPTDDTLDFFIDDTSRATLSICYKDLFSGKIPPFGPPLCGSALGGNYCYYPILFNRLCRIVCRGKKMQFHQIQYRLFPKTADIRSFSATLSPEDRRRLEEIKSSWNNPGRLPLHENGSLPRRDNTSPQIHSSFLLRPGETRQIADIRQGGRITGIEMTPASCFEGPQHDVFLRIYWDEERLPAVDCPVADFFGYAFGKRSMNSLLLGSQDDKDYCYFPMPFDRAARIELVYKTPTDPSSNPRSPGPPSSNQPSHSKSRRPLSPTLRLAVNIDYTLQKRDPLREGKFYADWKAGSPAAGQPHVFLNTRGKGHYVATILQAQGLQPGMTVFFEGDDSTVVDGSLRLHGTGSEDYFNGGWYAFQDCWDKKMSLPTHGALDYSLPYCRTGGYRLYLSDKISFERSIFHSIEHGPAHNEVPVIYTSLAFYYCDTPPSATSARRSNQTPNPVSTRVYYPDTLILFPQLLEYGLWNDIAVHPEWAYPTGGESYDLTVTDASRLRISLKDIRPGRYSLFADYESNDRGAEFSVWQGQTPLSGWRSTWSRDKIRSPLVSLGDLSLDEFANTLTLRFLTQEHQDHLFLNRLILVEKPALTHQ